MPLYYVLRKANIQQPRTETSTAEIFQWAIYATRCILYLCTQQTLVIMFVVPVQCMIGIDVSRTVHILFIVHV